MSSNAHFAKVPQINIPRSKFKAPNTLATSWKHGQLIPLQFYDVIPGDTFSLNLASLIRMSTPIAPIMDNIIAHVRAFFVPYRLLWKHQEEFYGANKTAAGYQSTTYYIPQFKMIDSSSGSGYSWKDKPGTLAFYLGYKFDYNDPSNDLMASVLPARAYYLIWNNFYRAETLQAPFVINDNDWSASDINSGNGCVGTIGSKQLGVVVDDSGDYLEPLQVCKTFDYFTACTIQPQAGNSVTLPFGTYAPIKLNLVNNVVTKVTDPSQLAKPGFIGLNSSFPAFDYGVGVAANTGQAILPNDNKREIAYYPDDSLFADLSSATAATVNSIRYAFQLQKYLERGIFGSNRYFEILNVHYGVTSPDARLQIPEYLGGCQFDININQVTSTADYAAGTTTKVGETGAVSVTANKSSIFTKGFVEPGIVMIMLDTKQANQSYCQGMDRYFFKKDRFEFYSPEFANLGDQAILNKEIYVADDANNDDVFGYQEHWAEYRYVPNRQTGLLNPSVSGSLDYWTLGTKFSSRPSLGETFIKESRDNITRCLKTGSTGPDYIGSFYFDMTMTREMPLYTIPGLIDHFGVR